MQAQNFGGASAGNVMTALNHRLLQQLRLAWSVEDFAEIAVPTVPVPQVPQLATSQPCAREALPGQGFSRSEQPL